jgi:hypothetical protein
MKLLFLQAAVVLVVVGLLGTSTEAARRRRSKGGSGRNNPSAPQANGNTRLHENNIPSNSPFYNEFRNLPTAARQNVIAALNRHNIPVNDASQLHADESGAIFYADDFEGASEGNRNRNRRTAIDIPPSRTEANGLPIYHSNPGSSNVIYLDFDGHVNPDNAWGAFEAMPFNPSNDDRDVMSPSFSNEEKIRIGLIWQRVAEDFAPFDVDVTTEEPATFTTTTCHCVITSDQAVSGVMPAQGAGGVAYVGVFGASYYNYYSPALVYWDNLGSGRDDFVAEAASHEIGHNLGLSHDGTSTSGYYSGDNTGTSTSWGPIMGTGYWDGVSQWSKGEYPDANNQEDDLAIMANKLSYRADDHGDFPRSATIVPLDQTGSFSVSGIIEKNTDVDVFQVVVGSGPLVVTAEPYLASRNMAGHNLDIGLSLRDSNGNIVARNAPGDNLAASLSINVNGGTYFVEITGTGHGTGKYTDYASLGHYDVFGVGEVPSTTTTARPTTPAPPTTTTTTTRRVTTTTTTTATTKTTAKPTTTTTTANPTTTTTTTFGNMITASGQGTQTFDATPSVTCNNGHQFMFCLELTSSSSKSVSMSLSTVVRAGRKPKTVTLARASVSGTAGATQCMDYYTTTLVAGTRMQLQVSAGRRVNWLLRYNTLQVDDTAQCNP